MGRLSNAALGLDPALIMCQAGLDPDPWQQAVLRSRPRRLLLNCSRQSGKSVTTACLALDEAVHRGPALVLLLSPSQRQSQELFRTVMQIHAKLGATVEPEAESLLRVELPNGSRILALPGNREETVRGYANVGLLVVDEASRVSDALYFALRPMLAVSGGRLVALSTPFGKRGWFYQAWTSGENWERVSIAASGCPRISAEFLAEEQRALPADVFSQEYFCTFAEAEGAVFRTEDVDAMWSDDIKPLLPQQSERFLT